MEPNYNFDTGCGEVPTPIDTAKPNLLIIGDSISMGYTLKLQADLTTLDVFHNQCNGAYAGHVNLFLDRYLAQAPSWDVITFNAGVWDIQDNVSLEHYLKHLRSIGLRLKGKAPRVIFFTTTSLADTADRRQAFNAAAADLMAEIGIEVYDLGIFSDSIEHLQLADKCHYTEAGYQALADQIKTGLNLQGGL